MKLGKEREQEAAYVREQRNETGQLEMKINEIQTETDRDTDRE